MPRPSYNFAAGPGMLPREVLQQARDELMDWQHSGMSVLEMPFTSEAYRAIEQQALRDLAELLDLPAHYRILFLQGGASAQFALLPLNLLPPGGRPTTSTPDTGRARRSPRGAVMPGCGLPPAGPPMATAGFLRSPNGDSIRGRATAT